MELSAILERFEALAQPQGTDEDLIVITPDSKEYNDILFDIITLYYNEGKYKKIEGLANTNAVNQGRAQIRKAIESFESGRQPFKKYWKCLMGAICDVLNEVTGIDKVKDQRMIYKCQVNELKKKMEYEGRCGSCGCDDMKWKANKREELYNELPHDIKTALQMKEKAECLANRLFDETLTLKETLREKGEGEVTQEKDNLEKALEVVAVRDKRISELKKEVEKAKEKSKAELIKMNDKLAICASQNKALLKDKENELKLVKQSSGGNDSYWEENSKELQEEVERKNKKIAKLEALLKCV